MIKHTYSIPTYYFYSNFSDKCTTFLNNSFHYFIVNFITISLHTLHFLSNCRLHKIAFTTMGYCAFNPFNYCSTRWQTTIVSFHYNYVILLWFVYLAFTVLIAIRHNFNCKETNTYLVCKPTKQIGLSIHYCLMRAPFC